MNQTSTPMTDAIDARDLAMLPDGLPGLTDEYRTLARRLERDRADLIAALANLENWATARGFTPSMNIAPVKQARATLARVRS